MEKPETSAANPPPEEKPSGSGAYATMRRCLSESEVIGQLSSSKFVAFKRFKTEVSIKDSSSTSSSSSTLVPKSFLRREIDLLDDFERDMESDFSGFGSSYSGLSRSCTTIGKPSSEDLGLVTRPSSSCCELSTPYEMKEMLPKFEALRELNKASKAYKVYTATSTVVEEYLQAKYHLELSYPNYWKHLSEKIYIELDSKTALEETECQIEFIETCKSLIEDEKDPSKEETENILKLSGEDLMKDFEICGLYMKETFPYVFTYLMKKFDFDKFSSKKLLVKKNRQEILNLSKQPHEELYKREEKYKLC